MSVTLQSNGKYLAYVGVRAKNGDLQRERRTFDSKAEAVRWEAETRLLFKAGKVPARTTLARASSKSAGNGYWSLQVAYKRACEERWKGTKAEATASRNAEAALNFFGPKTDVNLVTTSRVEEYIDYLKERNTGGTINRKLAALSVILKTAYKHDKLERLPVLSRQKEATQRPRWLSQSDVDRLIAKAIAIGHSEMADAITVAAYTGIRQGELLKLTASDFNKARRELVLLDTKNGRDHRIPLSSRPFASLEARAAKGEKLFDMTREALDFRWKRLTEMEDINARWHDLRHSFGSWMVQKGVPIETVSRLMNHSSIQVTMRYAYLAPSNYHDAISVLD